MGNQFIHFTPFVLLSTNGLCLTSFLCMLCENIIFFDRLPTWKVSIDFKTRRCCGGLNSPLAMINEFVFGVVIYQFLVLRVNWLVHAETKLWLSEVFCAIDSPGRSSKKLLDRIDFWWKKKLVLRNMKIDITLSGLVIVSCYEVWVQYAINRWGGEWFVCSLKWKQITGLPRNDTNYWYAFITRLSSTSRAMLEKTGNFRWNSERIKNCDWDLIAQLYEQKKKHGKTAHQTEKKFSIRQSLYDFATGFINIFNLVAEADKIES